MKLIIGGAYQGKGQFARRIAGCAEKAELADGGKDPFPAAFQRRVIVNFHEYIRRIVQAQESAKAERRALGFTRRLIRENPEAVVVCNELGCGIVPVEREERVWRELTGDTCRLLAEHADEVYRVVCGIPIQIKGNGDTNRGPATERRPAADTLSGGRASFTARWDFKYEHGGDVYSNKGIRLDYSVNVNPLGMPDFVVRAACDSMGRCGGYPDSECRDLRKAVSAQYRIEEDTILFGNGAAELIYEIARAVRPEKAVVTAPSFSEYRKALESAGAEIFFFSLKEKDGFLCDWEQYLELLARVRPQMIFICNPLNPVGTVEKRERLMRVLDYCEENHIFAVVDECFLEFTADPELYTCLPLIRSGRERLFVIQALTKTFAMAGLRLGYGFLNHREYMERIHASRQPWSVSVPAQAAGLAAFGPEREAYLFQTKRMVEEERQKLILALRAAGACVYGSEANYIFFKDRGDREPGALYMHFLRNGILIRSCANFEGLDGLCYRACVGPPGDNQEFIRILQQYS